MLLGKYSSAFKRYNLRVVACMAVYLAVLIPAVWLFKHLPIAGFIRYALAIAPAIPLAGAIGSMGLYLREESDEYLRYRMVEQMLWATGITLVAASVLGFLQSFGLVPTIETYWMVVGWFISFGVARVMLAWRR